MQVINNRVVHRSAALLGYGDGFKYMEATGAKSWLAGGWAGLLGCWVEGQFLSRRVLCGSRWLRQGAQSLPAPLFSRQQQEQLVAAPEGGCVFG